MLMSWTSSARNELEAQLCNGDLDVRGFIRGLAKTPFYKSPIF